jgi:hypothetical protein
MLKMNPNPYDAAIADIESRIAELNAALLVVKKLRDGSTGKASPQAKMATSTANGGDDNEIRSDSFFKLTIADAAIKFLRKWAGRTPQSTKAIIAALDRGGLKGKGYQTVYKILTRRAKEKEDVINVHGDWGLPEWYLADDASQQQAPPAFSGAALRDQQG